MKLYLVNCDGESYVVSALTLAEAVRIWQADPEIFLPDGSDAGEQPVEPDSVTHLTDNEVIRERATY